MRLKNVEQIVLGDEPSFTDGGTRSEMIRAYNWYSYAYDVSTARKWVIDYMKFNRFSAEDMIDFNNIKDDKISITLCSSCRMVLRGAKLTWNIESAIKSLLHQFRFAIPVVIKKTIKDENTLVATLDDVLDVFYHNYVDNTDISLLVKNASPAHVKQAIVHYTALLNELLVVDTDSQVKEAYSRLSKKQHKAYVAFVEKILAELTQTKVNNKRTINRKPRKRKMKSADQIVKNVKYQAEDKALNVVSLLPHQIVGASVVWVYNTKTRKLAKYQAADGSTLSIKGTTILNFNETSSQKTVRKPKDIIPMVISEAKVPLNKAYDKIKAVAAKVNGRINQFTLILRVIK